MGKLLPASQPVTFAGNALGCAVALKNIELMKGYQLEKGCGARRIL
jgi:adenosylmethionine-8-amino-7-oxononanoate aminotransferase